MKQFISGHWVWITSACAGLVLFLTPSVNAYIASHPQNAVAVGGVWAVVNALAKSPRQ